MRLTITCLTPQANHILPGLRTPTQTNSHTDLTTFHWADYFPEHPINSLFHIPIPNNILYHGYTHNHPNAENHVFACSPGRTPIILNARNCYPIINIYPELYIPLSHIHQIKQYYNIVQQIEGPFTDDDNPDNNDE